MGQLARYLLVGVGSNAVLYVAYLALTAAGMDPKKAMTLLYAVGVIQTFAFNRRWSFAHAGAHGPAFVRYCVSYGLGYVLNFLALLLMVDGLGYPHQIVQACMALILAAMLFIAQRYWVFRSVPSPRPTHGFPP